MKTKIQDKDLMKALLNFLNPKYILGEFRDDNFLTEEGKAFLMGCISDNAIIIMRTPEYNYLNEELKEYEEANRELLKEKKQLKEQIKQLEKKTRRWYKW